MFWEKRDIVTYKIKVQILSLKPGKMFNIIKYFKVSMSISENIERRFSNRRKEVNRTTNIKSRPVNRLGVDRLFIATDSISKLTDRTRFDPCIDMSLKKWSSLDLTADWTNTTHYKFTLNIFLNLLLIRKYRILISSNQDRT